MLDAKWSHAEGFCGRCWTYGTTCIYGFENMRSNLLNTGTPMKIAMRFLGEFGNLTGNDAFTMAQQKALKTYARAQTPSGNAGERIYEPPIPGHRYYMGVDAARGQKPGDESIFLVLDGDTRHLVYTWGDHEAMWTEYFRDIVDVADRYERALIWVEWASGGEGLMPMLMRMPNVRLYSQRNAAQRYSGAREELGFVSNQKSRSRILAQYISAVQLGCVLQADGSCQVIPGREGALYLTDQKTVDQTCRLYYNADKDGKIEVTGGHDDRVIAAAGAWEGWMSEGGRSQETAEMAAPRAPTYLDFLRQYAGHKSAPIWRP
jgi:hypothetical protein